MRRSLFLLAAISMLLFPAYASANITCVPFALKDVPDAIEERWQYRGSQLTYVRTRAGSQELLREVHYYGTASGLRLSVYKYAGEVVYKAWACKTGEDPVTKDKPDHRIALLKDRMWFSAYVQSPVVWREYDSEGYLTKLTFRLSHKRIYFSDDSLAERVVTMPRAWFTEPQAP